MANIQNVGSLAKANPNAKPKFSVVLQSEGMKNLINSTLQEPKRRANFVANISSVVANNPELQKCEASTIIAAGLMAESLNLSMSPILGQTYLIPYDDKKNNRKVAQFQLGYKGFTQLAIRSGYYKKLNVLAIKEGELIKFDPLNEEIEVKIIEDDEARENTPTIGYYAMFEYENGFKKAIYWSKKKVQKHAQKYSQGYAADLRKGTQYTFWSKDFDGMAYKTLLRQIISKWGIMSIEMQEAFAADQAVIDEHNNYTYVDNLPEDENGVIEEVKETPKIEDKVQEEKIVDKENKEEEQLHQFSFLDNEVQN